MKKEKGRGEDERLEMAREVIAETVRRDRQRDRGEKVEEEEISLGCGDYWEKWGL